MKVKITAANIKVPFKEYPKEDNLYIKLGFTFKSSVHRYRDESEYTNYIVNNNYLEKEINSLEEIITMSVSFRCGIIVEKCIKEIDYIPEVKLGDIVLTIYDGYLE